MRHTWIVSLAQLALTSGCLEIGEVTDESTGPHETEVDNADVDVERVDADTELDTEVNTDVRAVGANVAARVDVHVDPDITVDLADGGAESGVTATGPGIAFEMRYQGPIDDHALMTPSFRADLAVVGIEWRVRAVRFGEASILDDADTLRGVSRTKTAPSFWVRATTRRARSRSAGTRARLSASTTRASRAPSRPRVWRRWCCASSPRTGACLRRTPST